MKRLFRLPFFLAVLSASVLTLTATPTPDKPATDEYEQAQTTKALHTTTVELRNLLTVSITDRMFQQGKRLTIMLAALIAGTMSTQYTAEKTRTFLRQFDYVPRNGVPTGSTLSYSCTLVAGYALAYFLTSYLVATPEEQALYRTLVTWPALRKTSPASIAEKIEPLFVAFKGNGYQLSLDNASAKRVQRHLLEIVTQEDLRFREEMLLYEEITLNRILKKTPGAQS